jgi:hypothetical protein
VLGCTTTGGQPGQRLDQVISGAGAGHAHREGLAGVLIDDVGQLQPASISGLVELEVDRPDLVGALGPPPLRLLGSDPAAFAAPDRAA